MSTGIEIAYHASHEQFSPSELLGYVQKAEAAGFDAIHSSDHFHPWSKRQGQSGFTFSWIAAAMQATTLPYSMVCAPGQRLHPAIAAQAIATIAEMFPNRFSVELGSGEAINEVITGTSWPSKTHRNERLLECYNVIDRLLQGEEVNHHGHVHVKDAKLYTLPALRPPLFGAAISEETAAWCGTWAEGLITTAGPVDELEKKIAGFRKNGGEGKPVFVQLSFSFHPDKEKALDEAYDQWRSPLLSPELLAGFTTVSQFDTAAEKISREEVAEKTILITDVSQLRRYIDDFSSLDVNRVVLHNVGRTQELFIEEFKSVGVSREA